MQNTNTASAGNILSETFSLFFDTFKKNIGLILCAVLLYGVFTYGSSLIFEKLPEGTDFTNTFALRLAQSYVFMLIKMLFFLAAIYLMRLQLGMQSDYSGAFLSYLFFLFPLALSAMDSLWITALIQSSRFSLFGVMRFLSSIIWWLGFYFACAAVMVFFDKDVPAGPQGKVFAFAFDRFWEKFLLFTLFYGIYAILAALLYKIPMYFGLGFGKSWLLLPLNVINMLLFISLVSIASGLMCVFYKYFLNPAPAVKNTVMPAQQANVALTLDVTHVLLILLSIVFNFLALVGGAIMSFMFLWSNNPFMAALIFIPLIAFILDVVLFIIMLVKKDARHAKGIYITVAITLAYLILSLSVMGMSGRYF